MKKILIIPLLIFLFNFESRADLETEFKTTTLDMAQRNRYSTLVIKYCERYKLNKDIMLSLCIQENARHSARIVNRAGAVGIMQVKPICFRDIMRIAKRYKYLDTNRYPDEKIVRLLQIPRVNIRTGCLYFRHLLRRNRGNYILTMLQYNAGPSADEYFYKYANDIFMRCMK